MLIYSRIIDEVAPEAFTVPQDDPTVADLLAVVGASRKAAGRTVELTGDGITPDTTLSSLGIGHCDMVTVRASGAPIPDMSLSQTDVLDYKDLLVPSETKRLSEYEELTRWTQWEAPFYFNGPGPNLQVWSDDSTVLQAGDWNAYRTPDKLYFRTYATKQSRAGRAVETAFDFARKDVQLADIDPARVAHLQAVLGPLQYADWGLCVVHQQTTRFALSSWIAGATCFMMFDDLRHAQLYGRLAIAYGEHHDGFDNPRPAWMEQERFQPTRRIVEELLATLDWGKAIVLADLIFEPLNTAAAHALLTAGSLAAGDGLTPFVCRSIEEDKQRHRASAAEFLKLVCTDEQFAAINRELVNSWVEDLLPRAYAAASTLAGPSADLSASLAWINEQFTAVGIPVPRTADEVNA